MAFLFSKVISVVSSKIFATPEIVDPTHNNQNDILKEKTLFSKNVRAKLKEVLDEDRKDAEEHQERVDEILGE